MRKESTKLPTKTVTKTVVDDVAAGERIKTFRGRVGLSLRKLAVKMGISPPYLSDLEKGKRHWNQERFEKAIECINNHEQ